MLGFLLQNAAVLLQNATVITNYDSTYLHQILKILSYFLFRKQQYEGKIYTA